jgi:hypothetical protein
LKSHPSQKTKAVMSSATALPPIPPIATITNAKTVLVFME